MDTFGRHNEGRNKCQWTEYREWKKKVFKDAKVFSPFTHISLIYSPQNSYPPTHTHKISNTYSTLGQVTRNEVNLSQALIVTETRLQFWPFAHSLPFFYLLFPEEKKKMWSNDSEEEQAKVGAHTWTGLKVSYQGQSRLRRHPPTWVAAWHLELESEQSKGASTQSWAGQLSCSSVDELRQLAGPHWSMGWAGGFRMASLMCLVLGGGDGGWKTGLSWDYEL